MCIVYYIPPLWINIYSKSINNKSTIFGWTLLLRYITNIINIIKISSVSPGIAVICSGEPYPSNTYVLTKL